LLLPRLLQDGIPSDQSSDVDLEAWDWSTCGDWKQDSAVAVPIAVAVVGKDVAPLCFSSMPEPSQPGLSASVPVLGSAVLPQTVPAVQEPRVPDRLSMAGAVLALLPAAGARLLLLLLPLMRSSDISSSFGMLALPLASDALAERAVAALPLRSCGGLGQSSCDRERRSPALEVPGALPIVLPLKAPAAAGGSGCTGAGRSMFTKRRCLCTGESKGDGVATEAADRGEARHDPGAWTEGGAPK